MDERALQWRVGIVVICAALILGILIFLFGEGWKSQYTIFINPTTAPNVTKNTPVRKNGILIGRVAMVQNQDRGVMLTLRINSDEPIYANELCKIGTASFLGDAVIDFVPGNQPERGDVVPDRTLFNSNNIIIERNPLELIDVALDLQDDVSEALGSIKKASDTVDEAAQNIVDLTSVIHTAVSDEQSEFNQFITSAQEMARKADLAITSFNQLMANVNDVVGDPTVRENVRVSLNKMPQTIDEFTAAITDARSTLAEFKNAAAAADENLTNLAPLTLSLGEEGPEIVEQLNYTMQQIDTMIVEITGFAAALRESKGSLGKFVNDPELYNNLNQTLINIRNLSYQLQPLMNDVRYTVDGIARDPGQIGLKGVFTRSSGYKGSNSGSQWNQW